MAKVQSGLPIGKTVRVPMRFIDGKWEFELGGLLPAREGAVAEIVVRAGDLLDQELVQRYLTETHIHILPQGTPLRAMLAIKDIADLPKELTRHLLHWRDVQGQFTYGVMDNWTSVPPCFIEIILGKPTEKQRDLFEDGTGGLWLRLQGAKSIGLISSSIELPADIAPEPAISLNHAFTLLSEKYEPWRKSHTGNVYTRFFYQERNSKWYPLDLLRDTQSAKQEQEIAKDLWARLAVQMNMGRGE